MYRFRNSLKLLCWIGLGVFISGCEPSSPEDMLNNYQYRISNVMEVSQAVISDLPTRPAFPLRRHLIYPTLEVREGLLDVINLKTCNLLPLIAERNSSLGKVYAPSQKMRYELTFYHAIGQCKKALEDTPTADQALLAQVSSIYQAKHDNLPAELWNGIFTAKELELNFSRAKETLPLIDDGSSQNSINAMKTLIGIIRAPLAGDRWELPPALDTIESSYNVLYNNRSGPKILSSLQLLTTHLSQASDTLERGLQQKQLCFNNTPSTRAKIIQNVFYKYYIGEVQPYLANVHKYAVAWTAVNKELMASFKAYNLEPPEQLAKYQHVVLSHDEPDSLWARYLEARNKHTQSWQKLLKQCGMMPKHSD